MKAVILVGGEATRLKPLTPAVPKAMVPIVNISFLEFMFRHLGDHGIRDIILTQSHFAKPIYNYFGDGQKFGLNISYVIEEMPLGTAGAIKNSEHFLDDTFMVLNGDVFTDLNLTSLLDFHRTHKAAVTITLTPVEDPTKYGLIEYDVGGRVTRFLEKPKPHEVTTNTINAGTYIIEPEILSRIPDGIKVSIERDTFPMLVNDGVPVFAYNSDAYWIDIGTPEKYLQINRDIMNGRTAYRHPPRDETTLGEGTRLANDVAASGTVLLGSNGSVAAKAKLKGPLAIGDNAVIEDGAVVASSVLWNNVRIGRDAEVLGSIIANDCVIGDNCRVTDGVLGHGVKLPPGTVVLPGARLPEDA
jgi:mannose-1-phosphate guanylyltransferase